MNSTIIKKSGWFTLLWFGTFWCGPAFAGGFIRPAALYVDYTHDSLSAKAGGSVAFGTTWGPKQNHELSAEVAFVGWELDEPMRSPGPSNPGFGKFGSGDSTPVLLNYRYYCGGPERRWRAYIGASVGATRLSGNVVVALSGVNYAGKVSETKATFGGGLGVSGTITSNVSLDLSYRYLARDGMEIDSDTFAGSAGYTGPAGPRIQFPDTNARVFALSIKVQF